MRDKSLFDLLTIDSANGDDAEGVPVVRVKPSYNKALAHDLVQYRNFIEGGQLITLDFFSLNDYLHLLRDISQELGVLKGAHAMVGHWMSDCSPTIWSSCTLGVRLINLSALLRSHTHGHILRL